MQEVIRAWMGRWAGWLFALAMLGLSAFGVYLGRFLRWNSWDALVSPIETLHGAARVVNPWNDVQPLAFSLTFFAFSLVCDLILYSFAHLHGWVQKASPAPFEPSWPTATGLQAAMERKRIASRSSQW